ncbi:MAG: transcriptional repressor [Chloroflexota bacterium]|nr:transcriptional repressor [Chloroflexota bacterium]
MGTDTTAKPGTVGSTGTDLPYQGANHKALAGRLRAAGQRATPQRLHILGAFRPGEHLSADEVFGRVEQAAPALNRSTVYRTLELFRDLSLISETDLGGGVRHYELLEPGRHHHLVCRDCGSLSELDDDLVRPLREAIRARYAFDACIDHLALFGRCAACQERDPTPDLPCRLPTAE